MVHRAANGRDLWWLQALGGDGDSEQKIELTMQQLGYSEAMATLDLQQQARLGNKAAIDHWRTDQNNYQTSVDAGRGDTVTAPAKPPLTTVSDPIQWPDKQVTAGVPTTHYWPGEAQPKA